MRYFFLLLSLLGLCFTVSAQYYEISHLTEKEGLLNDRVYSFYEDTTSGVLFVAHPIGISKIYGQHIETIPIPEYKANQYIYRFENIKGNLFYYEYQILADTYEKVELPDYNAAVQITHTEVEVDTLHIEDDAYRDSRGHLWVNSELEDGRFELFKIEGADTIFLEFDFEVKSIFNAFFDGAYQFKEIASVIHEDNLDIVWLLSSEDELVKFDKNGRNPQITQMSVPNIYSIYQVDTTTTLISSYANLNQSNGLYLFKEEKLIKFIETERVPNFFDGPNGSVFIVDEGRLYNLINDELHLILEHEFIDYIDFDRFGNIYFWTQSQDYLSRFIKLNNGVQDTFYSSQGFIYDMKVNRDGIVWIASEKGITKIKPSSIQYKEYAFTEPEDPKTYRYVGNNKHGLSFYDAIPFLAYGKDKELELEADLFQGFISQSGLFYGHFLNIDYDGKNLVETFYSIDTKGVIQKIPMKGLDPYDYRVNNDYYGALYKDQFFLNSNLGAYHYNGNGFTKYPVPLEPTEEWKLELAFGSGDYKLFNLVANHLDFKRKKVVASKVFNYKTLEFEDPIWLADSVQVDRFYGGLEGNFLGKISQKDLLLNRFNGKSNLIEIPNSRVNDSIIKPIYDNPWLVDPIVDQANVYYFPASIHGLLLFLPEENKFIQFTEEDGLLCNEINHLFFNQDSSELYLSSYQGLQSISLEDLKNGSINHSHSWLRNEGMRELGLHQWLNDSILILHKEKGFISLNISNKTIEKPNLVIQSLNLFNKKVDWTDFQASIIDKGIFSYPTDFELPFNQNHLTFEFQGVDHNSTNAIQYTYQLKGLDKTPIVSRYGAITYQNLPSGEYIFSILATNDVGANSPAIEIKFKVLKPFYEEAWFIIACIHLFGIILYSLYQARIKALKHREKVLEQMVKEKTIELEDEKNFALEQKAIIEEKNREITDSILYSKRLQDSILPPLQSIAESLPKSFIYFAPKDIVSGDFYWFEKKEDTIFIACADCTGHGVPGAMVSLVCANALNRSVNEFNIYEPAKILNAARKLVIRTFAKSGEDMKDGMDISLCSIKGNTLTYAGAYNPAWIIRKKDLEIPVHPRIKSLEANESHQIVEVKADKQPVALFEDMVDFQQTSIELLEEDILYLFSDGFSDQFGGLSGKKLKAPNFRKLLLSLHTLEMNLQKEKLAEAFEDWKGQLEQIDDVCVMGVRI